MTMRRVLVSGVAAVLISASVLVAPFVIRSADAQPGPSSLPPTATATPGAQVRVVIPEVSADRDVGEATVTVTQDDATATLDVRFAATEAERERGLMWITTMPEDAGMLFLFPRDSMGGFWMKNTYLPLDIAFIDADGVVVSIKQGTPLDTTTLSPGAAYRSVIETNVGWWAEHGFSVGAHVTLPANLPEAS